eukprot:15883709-Heterocapsa_arctica.AAC.1
MAVSPGSKEAITIICRPDRCTDCSSAPEPPLAILGVMPACVTYESTARRGHTIFFGHSTAMAVSPGSKEVSTIRGGHTIFSTADSTAMAVSPGSKEISLDKCTD